MNKVILVGRLTADPELRYTSGNIPVTSFSIAVSRRYKAGEETQADFINIVAWAKTGEFCSKYFTKGQQVAVSGHLQTRNYDDKDGKKVYVTEVIAEDAYFADSKREPGANNFDAGFNPSAQPSNTPSSEGFMAIEEDSNLPF